MIDYESRHGAFSRVFTWAIVIIMTIGAFQLVDQNVNYYQASLLQEPSAPPFDGTVTPVATVPNWVALSSSEWSAEYSKITKRIPIPQYDASKLTTPVDQLVWGNEADNQIRNAKITFSTPYLGNYKLDGQENAGSHLAVDIKLPPNTPIRSIMNGVVVKAQNQSTGFGNHVVVRTKDAPSLSGSGKEILYTSYSHMSSLKVSENDIVRKGQVIGYSGSSGTATTPHLHFQIDKDTAPWHPYWPFTSKDASDAGVSFWEAVNIGLGMADAKAKTVNPMMYVQKFNSGSVFAAAREDANTSIVNTNLDNADTTVQNEPLEPEVIKKAGESSISSSDDFDIRFTIQKTYDADLGDIVVIVRLFGTDDAIFEDSFSGAIAFKLENNSSTIDPSSLSNNNFTKGRSKIKLKYLSPGKTRLIAEYNGEKFYSPEFEIRENVEIAPEADGKPSASSSDFFTDVSASDENYNAIKYLYQQGIISGYPDGTFKPDNKVSRVEALKIVTEALVKSGLRSENPNSLPFSDTVVGVWYSGYVATAFNNGLVNGYPDKTFRPAQEVNLAEFSKIALNAAGAKLPSEVKEAPFSDVPTDAWFAPFVSYAKDKNILNEKRNKIYPADSMTRRDVAEFVFRILVINQLGTGKYDPRLDSDMNGL